MDPPDEHFQPTYNWPTQHGIERVKIQAFAGHSVPSIGPPFDTSRNHSPMYGPWIPRNFQPASHIVDFHGGSGPEQHSYSHSIHWNYTIPSNQPQLLSSNVISTPPFSQSHHQLQQLQIQHQIPAFYPPNVTIAQDYFATEDLPAVYDETILHLINYSQPHPYWSSSESNSISISFERPQMTTRKRRAHYTSSYSAQVASRICDHRQNGLVIWEDTCSSTSTPTPTVEELIIQEDMTSFAKNSSTTMVTTGDSQAISMQNSSSNEIHSPGSSAMNSPPGLGTPQTFSWATNNEQQMEPTLEPSSLGEESSSASSAIDVTKTTPTPTQGHTNTVFIHSNIPRVSTNAEDENEDYDKYNIFFPNDTNEHRKLRIAMHDVMTSEWKVRDELEPTSSYLLQFSIKTSGAKRSVTFRCLLYHNGEPCDGTWSREERMLAHLRKAINLRPFACEEGEKAKCNCSRRFFTEATLQQHRKNIYTVKCEYCNSFITPRNKKRHQLNNCPNYRLRV